jgi:hypothetical protein
VDKVNAAYDAATFPISADVCEHNMTPEQEVEQDREVANSHTARVFHLHAIAHHEQALKFHREAVKFHGLGDIGSAAQNALLALTHTRQASKHTLAAHRKYLHPVT